MFVVFLVWVHSASPNEMTVESRLNASTRADLLTQVPLQVLKHRCLCTDPCAKRPLGQTLRISSFIQAGAHRSPKRGPHPVHAGCCAQALLRNSCARSSRKSSPTEPLTQVTLHSAFYTATFYLCRCAQVQFRRFSP